jgi:LmbE family N-acetylglucosaminyl deacetylase
MRKVLFISPHLDDAVFSCAARILRESEAGAKVIVATVFSHVRPRSTGHGKYASRRAEDRQGLRLLGAKPLWLGLFDAPSRNPFYNSFRQIVLETAPGDWDQALVVRAKIDRLLDELTPDALYLPLGVGSHIDHRLVFEAGMALAACCPRYYYEDLPYALVRHSVHLRFQEIQAMPFGKDLPSEYMNCSEEARQRGFLKSFRAAPYVRRYLPAGEEKKHCEKQLCQKLAVVLKPNLCLERETEIANAMDQNRILSALYAYRSQARPFLGSRKQLLEAAKKHARSSGFESWRTEHFWKPC